MSKSDDAEGDTLPSGVRKSNISFNTSALSNVPGTWNLGAHGHVAAVAENPMYIKVEPSATAKSLPPSSPTTRDSSKPMQHERPMSNFLRSHASVDGIMYTGPTMLPSKETTFINKRFKSRGISRLGEQPTRYVSRHNRSRGIDSDSSDDVPPPTKKGYEEVKSTPEQPDDTDKKHSGDSFDPLAPVHRDKYPILIQTLFLVSVAVAIKFYLWIGPIQFRGFIEIGEIGMVFTGLFFIQGMVLGGVNSDLKEAEKIPIEVVSGLEQIEDSFRYSSKKVEVKGLRLSYAQELLVHFARTWREYLVLQRERSYYQCMDLLREMIELGSLWDFNGGSCSGLLGAIDKVRRPVAKASVISRTDVLPAARALLSFFVITASGMLYLVTFKSAIVMIVVTTSVLTVIWFTLRMIHSMDNPFDVKPPTGLMRFMHGYMAGVKLFPLNEYIAKLEGRWLAQIQHEESVREVLLLQLAEKEKEKEKEKDKK